MEKSHDIFSSESSDVPQDLIQKVEKEASNYLKLGRTEWDLPHTRSVVYYATEIGRSEKADILVLATAA